MAASYSWASPDEAGTRGLLEPDGEDETSVSSRDTSGTTAIERAQQRVQRHSGIASSLGSGLRNLHHSVRQMLVAGSDASSGGLVKSGRGHRPGVIGDDVTDMGVGSVTGMASSPTNGDRPSEINRSNPVQSGHSPYGRVRAGAASKYVIGSANGAIGGRLGAGEAGESGGDHHDDDDVSAISASPGQSVHTIDATDTPTMIPRQARRASVAAAAMDVFTEDTVGDHQVSTRQRGRSITERIHQGGGRRFSYVEESDADSVSSFGTEGTSRTDEYADLPFRPKPQPRPDTISGPSGALFQPRHASEHERGARWGIGGRVQPGGMPVAADGLTAPGSTGTGLGLPTANTGGRGRRGSMLGGASAPAMDEKKQAKSHVGRASPAHTDSKQDSAHPAEAPTTGERAKPGMRTPAPTMREQRRRNRRGSLEQGASGTRKQGCCARLLSALTCCICCKWGCGQQVADGSSLSDASFSSARPAQASSQSEPEAVVSKRRGERSGIFAMGGTVLLRSISLRNQLRRLVETTKLGIYIEFVNAIMSLAAAALYVIETYAIEGGTASSGTLDWVQALATLSAVEFYMSMFFVLDFVFRLYISKPAWKYVVSIAGIIDVLTIVPVFLEASSIDIGDLSFLSLARVLRILRIVRVHRTFAYVESEVTRSLLKLVLSVISLVFVAAGVFHAVENIIVYKNSGELDFFTSVYFIGVSVTTVGYGDVQPASGYGRGIVLVLIAAAFVMLPMETNNFLRVMQSASQFASARYYPPRDPSRRAATVQVLVCGDVRSSGVGTFFRELLHEDHGGVRVHVVVLSPHTPSPYLKAIMDDIVMGPQITFLQGSPLLSRDMARAHAHTCDGAFVLVNKFSQRPETEDAAAMLTALAVKKYVWMHGMHDAHMYLQLIRPESKRHFMATLPSSMSLTVVCTSQMTMNLLAMSTAVPAVTTLLFNLLSSDETRNVGGSAPRWLREYLNGASYEVYRTSLSKAFANAPFHEAAALVYEETGVLMFGLELTDRLALKRGKAQPGAVSRIVLNPGSMRIPNYRGLGVRAFVVAKDKPTADLVGLGNAKATARVLTPEAKESLKRLESSLAELHTKQREQAAAKSRMSASADIPVRHVQSVVTVGAKPATVSVTGPSSRPAPPARAHGSPPAPPARPDRSQQYSQVDAKTVASNGNSSDPQSGLHTMSSPSHRTSAIPGRSILKRASQEDQQQSDPPASASAPSAASAAAQATAAQVGNTATRQVFSFGATGQTDSSTPLDEPRSTVATSRLEVTPVGSSGESQPTSSPHAQHRRRPQHNFENSSSQPRRLSAPSSLADPGLEALLRAAGNGGSLAGSGSPVGKVSRQRRGSAGKARLSSATADAAEAGSHIEAVAKVVASQRRRRRSMVAAIADLPQTSRPLTLKSRRRLEEVVKQEEKRERQRSRRRAARRRAAHRANRNTSSSHRHTRPSASSLSDSCSRSSSSSSGPSGPRTPRSGTVLAQPRAQADDASSAARSHQHPHQAVGASSAARSHRQPDEADDASSAARSQRQPDEADDASSAARSHQHPHRADDASSAARSHRQPDQADDASSAARSHQHPHQADGASSAARSHQHPHRADDATSAARSHRQPDQAVGASSAARSHRHPHRADDATSAARSHQHQHPADDATSAAQHGQGAEQDLDGAPPRHTAKHVPLAAGVALHGAMSSESEMAAILQLAAVHTSGSSGNQAIMDALGSDPLAQGPAVGIRVAQMTATGVKTSAGSGANSGSNTAGGSTLQGAMADRSHVMSGEDNVVGLHSGSAESDGRMEAGSKEHDRRPMPSPDRSRLPLPPGSLAVAQRSQSALLPTMPHVVTSSPSSLSARSGAAPRVPFTPPGGLKADQDMPIVISSRGKPAAMQVSADDDGDSEHDMTATRSKLPASGGVGNRLQQANAKLGRARFVWSTTQTVMNHMMMRRKYRLRSMPALLSEATLHGDADAAELRGHIVLSGAMKDLVQFIAPLRLRRQVSLRRRGQSMEASTSMADDWTGGAGAGLASDGVGGGGIAHARGFTLRESLGPIAELEAAERRPIVLLHPYPPSSDEWETVAHYSDVWYMRGSPLNAVDLRRARLHRAAFSVVLSARGGSSLAFGGAVGNANHAGNGAGGGGQGYNSDAAGGIDASALVDAEALFFAQAVWRAAEAGRLRQRAALRTREQKLREAMRTATTSSGRAAARRASLATRMGIGASGTGSSSGGYLGCRVICELVDGANVSYLRPETSHFRARWYVQAAMGSSTTSGGADGQLTLEGDASGSALMKAHPHFASGAVMTAGMLDALLVQAFYNPAAIILLEQLLLGSRTTTATSAPDPDAKARRAGKAQSVATPKASSKPKRQGAVDGRPAQLKSRRQVGGLSLHGASSNSLGGASAASPIAGTIGDSSGADSSDLGSGRAQRVFSGARVGGGGTAGSCQNGGRVAAAPAAAAAAAAAGPDLTEAGSQGEPATTPQLQSRAPGGAGAGAGDLPALPDTPAGDLPTNKWKLVSTNDILDDEAEVAARAAAGDLESAADLGMGHHESVQAETPFERAHTRIDGLAGRNMFGMRVGGQQPTQTQARPAGQSMSSVHSSSDGELAQPADRRSYGMPSSRTAQHPTALTAAPANGHRARSRSRGGTSVGGGPSGPNRRRSARHSTGQFSSGRGSTWSIDVDHTDPDGKAAASSSAAAATAKGRRKSMLGSLPRWLRGKGASASDASRRSRASAANSSAGSRQTGISKLDSQRRVKGDFLGMTMGRGALLDSSDVGSDAAQPSPAGGISDLSSPATRAAFLGSSLPTSAALAGALRAGGATVATEDVASPDIASRPAGVSMRPQAPTKAVSPTAAVGVSAAGIIEGGALRVEHAQATEQQDDDDDVVDGGAGAGEDSDWEYDSDGEDARKADTTRLGRILAGRIPRGVSGARIIMLPVPSWLAGSRYAEVVRTLLLEYQIVPMGVYRGVHPRRGIGRHRNAEPYVATNPSSVSTVDEWDSLYCVASDASASRLLRHNGGYLTGSWTPPDRNRSNSSAKNLIGTSFRQPSSGVRKRK